ncbi:hypothetical protein TNCV_3793581 [Trichonephila clavipes]|nr:hypothetical protein TNCV_3793581 [Trichonephila clavipes]
MADCLSNGEAAFRVCVECEMRMITLSRVARRSFLIRCCVNVVTSVPVRVPSPCTGSEASSVRTGQWGSPIVNGIPETRVSHVPVGFENLSQEQMHIAAWGILNVRRATSPLVRLVEGEERQESLTTSRVFSLKIRLNTVICMVWLITGINLAKCEKRIQDCNL